MRGLIVFLLLWPAFATAQNVTVRSGEHDSFSRLVLAIGPSTQWRIETTEDGAALVLPDRSVVFETAEIFDRIPRDRLQAVVQEDVNRLSLLYDCECHVDAFLWQPGQLVIDVIDGPNPFDAPTPRRPVARTPLPDLLSRVAPETAIARIDTGVFERSIALSQNEELRATEEALVEGLARAASQGFLEPAVIARPEAQVEPAADPAAAALPEPVAPRQSPHPGVFVTTALDRDFAGLESMLAGLTEDKCLSADLFEVGDWSGGRAFHEEVTQAMLVLDGDFGQVPANAAEELAKVYLHFGFGAEARMVLSVDPASSQQRQVLTELSRVIDDEPVQVPLLLTQAGCMSPASLWAFLARPERPDEKLRNRILQDYFSLPQPLRGQIAPRLANGFLSTGDTEAADRILRAAEGHDVAGSHEALSAQATLAEETGAPEVALAMLEQQADDNARTTPQSVIRLINLALEQGQMPSDEELILAAALRQEFRNDPVARDLAVAEALGYVAHGDHSMALDLLAGRTDASAADALNRTYASLSEDVDDLLFLEISFAPLPESLNGETRNKLAARVLDAGFPQRAKEILAPSAIREAAAERRYLLAEAALRLGQTTEVIDLLQGLNEARARSLRADAYTASGDHDAALSAASPIDSPADPVLEFRAGAWERLTAQQDPAFAEFAGAVLDGSAGGAVDTLADRREVLDQSRVTRQAVENLLLEFDVDSVGE